jgi:tRNA modification GTPase
MLNFSDTITAPATGNIVSALGIIRLSGPKAIDIISKIFVSSIKKPFKDILKANTLYYGTIVKADKVVDEVVISVFLSPHSFSGEDTIEITHHGSPYIQQEILQLLIGNGARLADRGEFSLRAFLNGKMNLSQAEAVADLIESTNEASHDLAIKQLRGQYNTFLKELRGRFLKIASLLELEIDFSAEQEVFVSRDDLRKELDQAKHTINLLVQSFEKGNAFKNGIPVAIVGQPNSGKSTLLNALLKDDRSIVSSIEGTTRDTIEETINVEGVSIRFIDTAGIRQSDNEIEKEGIKRSFVAIEKAQKIVYLVDASKDDAKSIDYQLKFLKEELINLTAKRYDRQLDPTEESRIVSEFNKNLILVINKEDISTIPLKDREYLADNKAIFISAKLGNGIDKVLKAILKDFSSEELLNKVFVTNVRHYQALMKAQQNVDMAIDCLENNLSADIISENIRGATEYIGQITGEITNDEVLGNIFSSFCIGK